MAWYQWATCLGIPSLISGLLMLRITRILARADEARKKAEEEKKRRDRLITEQNEAMEAQNKAIMAGVQALLRDRLLAGYRKYHEKGFADYEDRENLENVYKQYHALGANGVMDGLRQKFLDLPVYGGKNILDSERSK